MAQKDPKLCLLEERRSKLLLGQVPHGEHSPKELATRLAMWENENYTGLLSRMERQYFEAVMARRQSRRQINAAKQAKPRKARRMVGEGAYRKALNSVTSEHASMSAAEEHGWTEQLLPQSQHPEGALVSAALTGEDQEMPLASDSLPTSQDRNDNGYESPLKGVRFAALTAPGPTGTRPSTHENVWTLRTDQRLGALPKLWAKCTNSPDAVDSLMKHDGCPLLYSPRLYSYAGLLLYYSVVALACF